MKGLHTWDASTDMFFFFCCTVAWPCICDFRPGPCIQNQTLTTNKTSFPQLLSKQHISFLILYTLMQGVSRNPMLVQGKVWVTAVFPCRTNAPVYCSVPPSSAASFLVIVAYFESITYSSTPLFPKVQHIAYNWKASFIALKIPLYIFLHIVQIQISVSKNVNHCLGKQLSVQLRRFVK